ncbi:MAG: substrate-binding domain-containing protein [Micrococcales bacterium]|nr:substrate-binding domain-containing protein [Micrococcales bacterium]
MTRTRAFALLGASTLALTLAACGSPTPAATSTPTATPSPTATVHYEPIMTPEEFPRMDGSTANIPLGSLVLQRTTGLDAATADNSIQFNTTSRAYERLAEGEVDLILAYEPSAETRAKVDPRGRNLESHAIGRDALVFLTNEDNPVDSLTAEQVRDIYTGKITSWSQVGGPDVPIMAFQRPEVSGSQTLMRKLVMGDATMTDPPTELVAAEMGSLVDGVASYANSSNALGYSVFYYVSNQYAVDGIKLIAIDGVTPSNETIADGTYPWVNEFYVVVRADEPADSPARKIVEWLGTDPGRQTIKDAGYVAL